MYNIYIYIHTPDEQTATEKFSKHKLTTYPGMANLRYLEAKLAVFPEDHPTWQMVNTCCNAHSLIAIKNPLNRCIHT